MSMCLLLKVEVEATPNPKKGNWGLKETFKFRNVSGPLVSTSTEGATATDRSHRCPSNDEWRRPSHYVLRPSKIIKKADDGVINSIN